MNSMTWQRDTTYTSSRVGLVLLLSGLPDKSQYFAAPLPCRIRRNSHNLLQVEIAGLGEDIQAGPTDQQVQVELHSLQVEQRLILKQAEK
jgi:hypothetical protein